MKQFISFIQKEFYHIFRDGRTLFILLAMPIVLLILFGYAITTEIKMAPVTILDYSRDAVTRSIADRLMASEYFELYRYSENQDDVQALFRQGKAKLAIVFPPHFADDRDSRVQILADATDPNEATQLASYAAAIIQAELWEEQRIEMTTLADGGRVTPVTHLLYNPQMKGAYNFVPGVMGLILILICALMTSVGIVREKEMGTMEVLLVSPLKPLSIIVAKAIPYLLVSMVNVATILMLSYFLLEVPIVGSLTLLIGISILYALVALSLGLFISTVTQTQQAAMLISALVLMLPVILLSGMVFPVENMPRLLQWFSHIVPAKWYIIAVKDVMIKGVPLSGVLKEVGILLFMAFFILVLSVKRFKTRLE
ncbi:ABC transporter permease [Parabacteroides sp. PF5-6]|uniref:ABC transporter permease n=1 Tax=Parabacteroides sp. PF5-6 TaxID=1742403 RepID=UPI0024056C45|nr:ABC transporter permease [Parabacteroides sp. PF5-6]MDF9828828.1 ABC-2 type transport system permease protein [Parabacteroides sp. PF5-6]